MIDVKDYLPFVKQIAFSIKRRLPRHVDVNDLISAGSVGLMQAANKFDPNRGVDFKAYAYRRIYGSIMDYVRKEIKWAKITTNIDPDDVVEDNIYLLLDGLSSTEQYVLSSIYSSGKTLSDVANQLKCSPSRVWQIKTHALKTLKKSF